MTMTPTTDGRGLSAAELTRGMLAYAAHKANPDDPRYRLRAYVRPAPQLNAHVLAYRATIRAARAARTAEFLAAHEADRAAVLAEFADLRTAFDAPACAVAA